MTRQLTALAFLASICTVSAWAQDEPGVDVGDQELTVLPDFKSIDTNADGMITMAETEVLADLLKQEHEIEFRFDAVDENRDGQINSKEYMAYDARLRKELGIA